MLLELWLLIVEAKRLLTKFVPDSLCCNNE
jgi:hypothetical protein